MLASSLDIRTGYRPATPAQKLQKHTPAAIFFVDPLK
jgi:hypothetical protein